MRHSLVLRLLLVCLVLLTAFALWRSDGRPGPTAVPETASASSSPPRTTPLAATEPPDRAASGTRELGRVPAVLGAPPTASTEGPVLRILVRTGTGPKDEYTPTSDVAFELRRYDSVTEGVLLFRGRTDARGERLVELQGISEIGRDERGRIALLARVLEPGLVQARGWPRRRRVERGEPEPATGEEPPLVIQLNTRAGSTLRGRVVDEAGQPVEADVHLVQWILLQGVRRLNLGTWVLEWPDGRFEIDLTPEESGEYVILADAGERGTGSLLDLTVDAADPARDLVVVVRGPGVVRGHVLDGSGEPAAGLDLLVLLADPDDEDGSLRLAEPAASERKVEGRGRTWVTTRTDLAGAFEVLGLRADTYVVRTKGRSGRRGYPELLTPRPVQADGVSLELELSRPHLVLRLLDAEGAPWPESLDARSLHDARMGRIHDWPQSPRPLVLPCVANSDPPLARRYGLESTSSGPGEYVFELREGSRYFVGVVGGTFDGRFELIDVPPGSGGRVIERTAREELSLGSVSVTVTTAGVELGTEGAPRHQVRLTLEQVETGLRIQTTSEYASRSPFRFAAPPGLYRVVAEGDSKFDGNHGTLLQSRTLGRAEVEVELMPDFEQTVELELAVGGRLEITVQGEPQPTDRQGVLDRHPGIDEELNAGYIESRSKAAELQLVGEGHRPEGVARSIPAQYGSSLTSFWTLGETQISEVLPAGRYVLRGRTPGGREARVDVVIRPGATTVVELRF